MYYQFIKYGYQAVVSKYADSIGSRSNTLWAGGPSNFASDQFLVFAPIQKLAADVANFWILRATNSCSIQPICIFYSLPPGGRDIVLLSFRAFNIFQNALRFEKGVMLYIQFHFDL